jgi:hypothetical protein
VKTSCLITESDRCPAASAKSTASSSADCTALPGDGSGGSGGVASGGGGSTSGGVASGGNSYTPEQIAIITANGGVITADGIYCPRKPYCWRNFE